MGSAHIDRYLLRHSTYLEMPMLHKYDDQIKPHATVIWMSLEGKVSARDWPEIAEFLKNGYQVYSFDFRGLGELRMNYRARSSDDSELPKENFDQAYVSPLSSVLADYVYNSLLTGRPYFLQLMDDLKIAELFIRSRSGRSDLPLTIAATNGAYSLAIRFVDIDSKVKVLRNDSAPSVDWCPWSQRIRKNGLSPICSHFGASCQADDATRHSAQFRRHLIPSRANGHGS